MLENKNKKILGEESDDARENAARYDRLDKSQKSQIRGNLNRQDKISQFMMSRTGETAQTFATKDFIVQMDKIEEYKDNGDFQRNKDTFQKAQVTLSQKPYNKADDGQIPPSYQVQRRIWKDKNFLKNLPLHEL